jgi:hypothetical protein
MNPVVTKTASVNGRTATVRLCRVDRAPNDAFMKGTEWTALGKPKPAA